MQNFMPSGFSTAQLGQRMDGPSYTSMPVAGSYLREELPQTPS